MEFRLRRATDAQGLELARVHAVITRPRRGEIAWSAFDRGAYDAGELAVAAEAWRERARQEYTSLALFTQLASQVHVLGAPLDWAGAFVRLTGDEVRHTELCARMSELLGGDATSSTSPAIEAGELHLAARGPSLRAHVRETVVAAFCIGETLSGRMFRRCLRAATDPVARDVVRTITDDETFHGRFGWELGALLMRNEDPGIFAEERVALACALPDLFAHYRHLCGADRGEAWARAEPETDSGPNFGTLSVAGYARAFYVGMTEDVVPGLVAIGLPEAEQAWRDAAR